MRVLVVEDEQALAKALVEALEGESFAVDLAAGGSAASELADANVYDLILLDCSVPPPTGIDLLRRWRGEGRDTPVLVLTGGIAVTDRADGPSAHDYLIKPFSRAELLARARGLLRRSPRPLYAALKAGDVAMDLATHRVTVGGEPLSLSPKELALLEYLLLHKDEVVSRSEISEHVWEDSFDVFANVIDVTVHRLRKKIDGARPARLLHTVKGVGYVLRGERA